MTDRMQASGRAYVNPKSTDAYKGTAEKYNAESQKLEHINGRLYSSYNKLKNKVAEYRQKNTGRKRWLCSGRHYRYVIDIRFKG